MDIKKMTDQELKDYVIGCYDVCVELIRRKGYYPKWKAVCNPPFVDYEGAIKVAKAIAEGEDYDGYVDQCLTDLWDESCIEAAGIDEEEYYEDPEEPVWEREGWVWDEESEEWEEE